MLPTPFTIKNFYLKNQMYLIKVTVLDYTGRIYFIVVGLNLSTREDQLLYIHS